MIGGTHVAENGNPGVVRRKARETETALLADVDLTDRCRQRCERGPQIERLEQAHGRRREREPAYVGAVHLARAARARRRQGQARADQTAAGDGEPEHVVSGELEVETPRPAGALTTS